MVQEHCMVKYNASIEELLYHCYIGQILFFHFTITFVYFQFFNFLIYCYFSIFSSFHLLLRRYVSFFDFIWVCFYFHGIIGWVSFLFNCKLLFFFVLIIIRQSYFYDRGDVTFSLIFFDISSI